MTQRMISLNCRERVKNNSNRLEYDDFEICLNHREGEPENVNRLVVARENFSVELLPSKGLSVGEAFYQERPIFWEPPVDLVDPDTLVLASDEVWRNRQPAPGMVFIKTYMGGIELLGLGNWGMPHTDPNTDQFHVLHGEVGNIPVETVTMTISEDKLVVQGAFLVRTFEGDEHLPWYQRGDALYEVTRTVVVTKEHPTIRVTDSIKNISAENQTPDWGYHVTLRPEKRAAYLIPSQSIELRGGGAVPPEHEIWPPAENAQNRVERGIIHKGLQLISGMFDDQGGVRSLLRYPDGSGIAVATTPAPYFQTWFSVGGFNTQEFTYADGTQILKKNWDGQGIEFGSSGLDHDGNIDPAVTYDPILHPDQTLKINILVEVLSPEKTQEVANDIRKYNQKRTNRPIS
jgi:hypothetical protein